MEIPSFPGGRVQFRSTIQLLFIMAGYCGTFGEFKGNAQDQAAISTEQEARNLKAAAEAQAEQYRTHLGPVGLQFSSALHFSYVDNAFYSETNRLNDFVISPEVDLDAFLRVSEINSLRLKLGISYDYYVKNTVLNQNAPMINPDTELLFNFFAGDFHFRLHEKFSYLQTLFINTTPNEGSLLYNVHDVGTFSRWDNFAGFNADWDMEKVIVTFSYDHENFVSTTAAYDYLTRASEWFTGSVSYLYSDDLKLGLETQAGLHNYETENPLDDHWQVRAGPFVEFELPVKTTFRTGGGYDTALYDPAGESSDFNTYYAYGQLSQETRLFTHSLSAGHEHLLGFNANNLEDTYVRYSIQSPLFEHLDLGVNASVHFDKEYGGAYLENYTYYLVGLKAGYQFHKYWRADLGYEYLLKNSDLPEASFYRNRVTVGLTFTF